MTTKKYKITRKLVDRAVAAIEADKESSRRYWLENQTRNTEKLAWLRAQTPRDERHARDLARQIQSEERELGICAAKLARIEAGLPCSCYYGEV
jgi:hypothetical protein